MTAEELSALIKDEIGEDARLHAILDRIRDGKANLTDSELYAAITARITAQQMRRNVLSLDKREAAFVDITRERYTDTFTVCSAVQRILDAANGIHIRPQKPPFEEGRARKIGHSLEDRTVPDSTSERRARSATENFCMSHHDDCMRVNAEFRARAGLQSYAIRDGSAKCCDWCADVSGKYPVNETPAGFWGRHDNCKCSILYESKRSGRQLLRGTSKKWEQVAPGAGAEPLVRLTKEQAQALQEKNRTVVLTKEQAAKLQAEKALTILSGNGTMELLDSIELFHGSDVISDDQKKTLEEALAPVPEKLLRQLSGFVKKIQIEDGRTFSSYNREKRTVILDKKRAAKDIVHELGHAFGDMIGVYEDPEFLKIIAKGLDLQDWKSVFTEKHPERGTPVYYYKGKGRSKFVIPYQARVYVDPAKFGKDNISPSLFREYISVGFDFYFNHPKLLKTSDPDLYHYLEVLINGYTD